ncbi:MAG: potassium-transporting ATPase subunit KdpA [Roseiflexaceae bacterium]
MRWGSVTAPRQTFLQDTGAGSLSLCRFTGSGDDTAISFAIPTWQAYGGETTISYFGQIVGLAAQNFLAGAPELAVESPYAWAGA